MTEGRVSVESEVRKDNINKALQSKSMLKLSAIEIPYRCCVHVSKSPIGRPKQGVQLSYLDDPHFYLNPLP